MPYPGSGTFPGGGVFPGVTTPPVTTGKVFSIGALTFQDQPGIRFRAMRIEGWDGATASTLVLQQKPRSPGGWRSVSPQHSPRVPVLSGIVETDTLELMQSAFDQINSACTLDEALLTVTINGTPRWAFVSQQAEPAITLGPTGLVRAFSLQLSAADPRKYANPLVASSRLPSATGGWTFPFTFPLAIGSSIVAGQCSLTNTGNTTGPVLMRIDGPVGGPVITHIGTGAQLVFAASLVLGVGEWLDVDMEAQTTLANGQASRNGYVTSRGWSGFEPGVNEWAFAAQGPNVSALLTVTAYPAWN